MPFLAPLVPLIIGAADFGVVGAAGLFGSGLLVGASISGLVGSLAGLGLSLELNAIERKKAGKAAAQDKQALVSTMSTDYPMPRRLSDG